MCYIKMQQYIYSSVVGFPRSILVIVTFRPRSIARHSIHTVLRRYSVYIICVHLYILVPWYCTSVLRHGGSLKVHSEESSTKVNGSYTIIFAHELDSDDDAKMGSVTLWLLSLIPGCDAGATGGRAFGCADA